MEIEPNSYSEVYDVLRYMDKEAISKIPIDILKEIKEKKNPSYVSKIDPKNIFDRNNISEQAFKILMWINLNYWAPEEEKERINELLKNRIQEEEFVKKIEYQKEFGDKNDSIFTKEKIAINQENASNLMKVKDNFLKRILRFIKSIFRK